MGITPQGIASKRPLTRVGEAVIRHRSVKQLALHVFPAARNTGPSVYLPWHRFCRVRHRPLGPWHGDKQRLCVGEVGGRAYVATHIFQR